MSDESVEKPNESSLSREEHEQAGLSAHESARLALLPTLSALLSEHQTRSLRRS